MNKVKICYVLCLLFCSLFSLSQSKEKIDQINWIPLDEATQYAEKYNQKILIYFYKKDCPYCDKMQKSTLDDSQIINIINNNFLPVRIDSRTKKNITYNGKVYSNQQPVDHGYTWRHDFYYEVAKYKKGDSWIVTTPSVVLFDKDFKKTKLFAGEYSKQRLLREFQKIGIR